MGAITGNGQPQTGLGGAAGFGEITLARSDDGSFAVDTSAVFSSGFTMAGVTYSAASLYVSTDGFVTFGAAPNAGYLANPASLTTPFLAAFMADVDTRLDNEGTESGPIYVDVDAVNDVVTITWADVGFYRRNADLTNTFQLQLFDRGALGMDVVMRYGSIEWTSGDVQGGWDGLGGTPATTGLRITGAGGVTPLPATGDEAAQLALPTTIGNTGHAGMWVYTVPMTGGVVGVPPPPIALGGAGNDAITGYETADTLLGNAGNDLLEGAGGADRLDGGTGRDTAAYQTASQAVTANLANPGQNTGDAAGDVYIGIENLMGSAFGDALTGDAAANLITGGGGNDTLAGNAGADTLIGGAGFDWADYTAATAGLTANLTSAMQNAGFAAGDDLREIEGLIGSAFDDTLIGAAAGEYFIGGAGRDVLRGEGGADTLEGGDGDDTLLGGVGSDTLRGGAGIDWASYEFAGSIRVDLASPLFSNGEAAGDSYDGIEGIIGSAGADTLAGNGANNRFMGSTGGDVLQGHGGDDSLWGEGGNDTLDGGAGSDALIGGSGFDIASYANSAFALRLDFYDPSLNTGDAFGDSWAEIEGLVGSNGNDTLSGNDGANWLDGGAGDDVVDGLSGADTLYGGAGNDSFLAGAGADIFYGGAGVDSVSYEHALRGQIINMTPSADTFDFGAGDEFDGVEIIIGSHHGDFIVGDGSNNTIYGGAGEDCLFGGAFTDILYGGADADLLEGGNGTDQLDGGAGDDLLAGGNGADSFVHNGTQNSGTDWILDFTSGNGDVLVFSGAGATLGEFAITASTRARLWVTSEPVLIVTHLPTGRELWVLENQGDAITDVDISIGGVVFDLL